MGVCDRSVYELYMKLPVSHEHRLRSLKPMTVIRVSGYTAFQTVLLPFTCVGCAPIVGQTLIGGNATLMLPNQ